MDALYSTIARYVRQDRDDFRYPEGISEAEIDELVHQRICDRALIIVNTIFGVEFSSLGLLPDELAERIGANPNPWPGLTNHMLSKMTRGRVRQAGQRGIFVTRGLDVAGDDASYPVRYAAFLNQYWLEGQPFVNPTIEEGDGQ